MGFTLVNAFGLPGDSLGAQAVYSEGPVGYNTTAWGPYAIYGSGNHMGLSYLVDGIFNLNTPVELTRNWSAVGYYEHVWSPQWRTSIYGGLLGTDFGSEGKALICAIPNMPVGFSSGQNGVFMNSNTPAFPTNQTSPASVINGYKGNVSNCDPNSNWTQLGTRTMWNPVPDVDVGFDLSWVHLNTAFAGAANLNVWGTPFQQDPTGWPGGAYSINDQNVLQRHVPYPSAISCTDLCTRLCLHAQSRNRSPGGHAGVFFHVVRVPGDRVQRRCAGDDEAIAHAERTQVRPEAGICTVPQTTRRSAARGIFLIGWREVRRV